MIESDLKRPYNYPNHLSDSKITSDREFVIINNNNIIGSHRTFSYIKDRKSFLLALKDNQMNVHLTNYQNQ